MLKFENHHSMETASMAVTIVTKKPILSSYPSSVAEEQPFLLELISDAFGTAFPLFSSYISNCSFSSSSHFFLSPSCRFPRSGQWPSSLLFLHLALGNSIHAFDPQIAIFGVHGNQFAHVTKAPLVFLVTVRAHKATDQTNTSMTACY